jgi:hypothetical protein
MPMGAWILLGATAAGVVALVILVVKRPPRGADRGSVSAQWLAEQRMAADDRYR